MPQTLENVFCTKAVVAPTSRFVLQTRALSERWSNCSLLRHNGRWLAAIRTGWAKSRIKLVSLSDEFRVEREQTLDTGPHHERYRWHAEDPRIFCHDGILRFTYHGDNAHIVLGTLDGSFNVVEQRQITYGNRGQQEKNWMFFVLDDGLFAVQRVAPFNVVRVEDAIATDQLSDSASFRWDFGEARGGSPAVRVDDEFYSVFQSHVPYDGCRRYYVAGLMTFSATPPFRILRVSDGPILTPGSVNRQFDSVVFPAGLQLHGNHWYVSYGHNDQGSYIARFEREEIEQCLRPIQRPFAVESSLAPEEPSHSRWAEASAAGGKVVDSVTIPIGTYLPKISTTKIVGSTFWMGSPSDETGHQLDESLTKVTVTGDLHIGIHPVTKEQWTAVMDSQPWLGRSYVNNHPQSPAVYISWEDANEFCQKLSFRSGFFYRLPTEAEWEFACRAGSKTAYSFGNDPEHLLAHGWFWGNTGCLGQAAFGAQPVCRLAPNRWGLFDMHGNVWEWCSDQYVNRHECTYASSSSQLYVHRGGGWFDNAELCRSADRTKSEKQRKTFDIGFRVIRVPTSTELEHPVPGIRIHQSPTHSIGLECACPNGYNGSPKRD